MQVDETGSALQDLTYNWWGDNLKSLGLKRSLTEVKLCAMKRRGWSVLQEWISSNITEENKSLITGHWNDSELNRCISTYLILTTALVGHDLATKPNSVCGGLVAKSCPTLCNPMDCSPSGSSVRGISQVRILEWVVISFSRGSSQPTDQTCVSCIGRQIITKPPGKPNRTQQLHQRIFIVEKWKVMSSQKPLYNCHSGFICTSLKLEYCSVIKKNQLLLTWPEGAQGWRPRVVYCEIPRNVPLPHFCPALRSAQLRSSL